MKSLHKLTFLLLFLFIFIKFNVNGKIVEASQIPITSTVSSLTNLNYNLSPEPNYNYPNRDYFNQDQTLKNYNNYNNDLNLIPPHAGGELGYKYPYYKFQNSPNNYAYYPYDNYYEDYYGNQIQDDKINKTASIMDRLGFGFGEGFSALASLYQNVGVIASFKAVAATLPSLSPFIPIIFIAFVLISMFPVPILTIPTGRKIELYNSLWSGLISGGETMGRKAIEVLESEQCIERISCQIGKRFKEKRIDLILPHLEKFKFIKNNKWYIRFSKTLKNLFTNDDESCNFSCNPMARIKRALKL